MALMTLSLVLTAAVGEAQPAAPVYEDRLNILFYKDASGASHPVNSPADWLIRRAHVLANMQVVMGPMPGDDRRVPLEMRVEDDVALPKYIRKKISFAVEKGDRLPAYLLIPKGLNGKTPAVLCLHPTHNERGKDVVVGLTGAPNRNYAEELAERGYVTLAPDYPNMGEYKIDVYAMGYASATMKAIWNHMRCVDLLQSLPEVDANNIGCIGHSLGGHNTVFVGVFDPRIKVMVSSCGFCSFAKYQKGDLTGWSHKGYMPRIADVYGKDAAKMPFEFTEVLGALAPRAVFVNAPLHDDNFDVYGARDCVQSAMPIYRLFGAPDNLAATYPDCGHDFPPEAREAAYRFIAKALGRG